MSWRRAVPIVALALGCRPVPADPPASAAKNVGVREVASVEHHAPLSSPSITPDNPQVAPQASVVRSVTGVAETIELGGGWRATIRPADITASLGDELAFTIELRGARGGAGRPVLMPRWWSTRLLTDSGDLDASGMLPFGGGVAHAVVVANPDAWSPGAGFLVEFKERQAHGSLASAEFAGPRIHFLEMTSLVPVVTRELDDRCDLPRGLSVTVDDATVTAYYSSGPVPFPVWVRARGEFVVRELAGRPTLIGFVRHEISHFGVISSDRPRCSAVAEPSSFFTGPPGTSAVMARFEAPRSGPLDVVIYTELDGHTTRHATGVLIGSPQSD